MLDKGQEDDWFGSNFIRIFAMLGRRRASSAAIIWEVCRRQNPVVDLPLLKDRSFLFTNILMFCVGFVLNSTTVMLPQFVQQLLGYNATKAGLILMPGGFTLMVMMPVAGILVKRVQPKYLMAVGLLITAGFHVASHRLQHRGPLLAPGLGTRVPGASACRCSSCR